MHTEFTAIIAQDAERIIAYSLDVPGPNGQGRRRASAGARQNPRSRSLAASLSCV